MGRQNNDQGPLFYEFRLDEAVPADHLARKIDAVLYLSWRIRGTVATIERGLLRDGFVLRYDTGLSDDGLPAGEGLFIACSFWLADPYLMLGRRHEAVALFERLLSLCNDVGLLSEEYEPRTHRLVGNFPQAFSHLALVNTASNLSHHRKPAKSRLRLVGHGWATPSTAI